MAEAKFEGRWIIGVEDTVSKEGPQNEREKGEARSRIRKARVLVLHGHGQSGAWFEAKTRFLRPLFDQALRDSCQPGAEQPFPEGFELIYATGYHQLEPSNLSGGMVEIEPSNLSGGIVEMERSNLSGGIVEIEDSSIAADFDAWTWGRGDYSEDEIEGFEESIRNLIQLLHDEGPFIGIVGFSGGASTALTLVSIAERGATNDIQEAFRLEPSIFPPPFRFALFFCGFILSHPRYRPFFYPKINTPVLHFIGEFDTTIPMEETSKFSNRCKNVVTIIHPGTHFVPRYSNCQEAMRNFLTHWMGMDGIAIDEESI